MVKGLCFVFAYIVTARLGLSLAAVSGFATMIWIPTGMSFAALYLWGRQFWPAVFIGAAVTNYLTGADLTTAFFMGGGNALEAWMGVTLFRKFAGPDSRLETVRDVATFVGSAAVASTIISASIGVTALLASGIVTTETFLPTWLAWWTGDFLSDLIIAPVFLVWRYPKARPSQGTVTEGAILGTLVVGLVLAMFSEFPKNDLHEIVRPHWIFLFLIWGTLRFSQHANVLMSLLLSAIAITGTMMGHGPYTDGHNVRENLLLLQMFSSSIALSGLFFGALGREKENALRVRTDFISIASHELRTPITGLAITLDVLRELLKENADNQKYELVVNGLDRQARKLTTLVDTLLNVSKLESGNLVLEKKDTDLSLLVQDVSRNLGDLFEKTNCNLNLRIQPAVRGVCSSYGMEQVLTNLLMNSLKYGAGKPVTIELTEKNNRAVLQVIDGGMGIPAEHQEKIFERYHRVNSDDSKGLGLGLYISRLIVDAHHGKITVSSVEGKGSTFTVEIPFAS